MKNFVPSSIHYIFSRGISKIKLNEPMKKSPKRDFLRSGRPEDLVVSKNPPHPAKNVLINETCKKALFIYLWEAEINIKCKYKSNWK